MKFWNIGIDFKQAPLELRAKATPLRSFREEDFCADLPSRVFIATCNRLELYSTSSVEPEEVRDRWAKAAHLDETEKKNAFRIRQGRHAVDHLFRVCASLESMVLGESQIAGQVRRSYQVASKENQLDSHLHNVFQTAFRVAKRIRSETEIGQFSVSLPSVGVKLAERVLGNLSHLKVGVLGAGEIGRVAAEHFGSVLPRKLMIYNRSFEKAEHLALQLKTEGVASEATPQISLLFSEADVIVSAVSAELNFDETTGLLKDRSQPVFVLDLSVPASLKDPDHDSVFFYSVDDLKRISEENTRLREQELDKADQIIQAEVLNLEQKMEKMGLQQMVQSLHIKLEDIREKELEALRLRLPNLSQQHWAEVEKMSKRLSNKILQDPIVELKNRTEKEEEHDLLLSFFRKLFRI